MSTASTVPSEQGLVLSPSPIPLPPQRTRPQSEAPSRPIVLHVAEIPRRITTRVARTVASVAQEKRDAKVRVVEPAPLAKRQQPQAQVKADGTAKAKAAARETLDTKPVNEEHKMQDVQTPVAPADPDARAVVKDELVEHKSPAVLSESPTSVDIPSPRTSKCEQQASPSPAKVQMMASSASPPPAPEPTLTAAPAPAHTIFKPSFGGPRRQPVASANADSSLTAPAASSPIKSFPASQVVEITSELPSSPSPTSTTVVPTLFSSKPDLSAPSVPGLLKPSIATSSSPTPALTSSATKPAPTSPPRPIFLSMNPTTEASHTPVVASSRTSSLPFLTPPSPTSSSSSPARPSDAPLVFSQRTSAVSPASALPSVFSFGVTASTAASVPKASPPLALFDTAPAVVTASAAAASGGYLPSFGEPAAAGGARAGRRQGMAFQ
ncbi:hypothetical protein BCR44DRAFT_325044, partial [Catenaria anguillulae PL171]